MRRQGVAVVPGAQLFTKQGAWHGPRNRHCRWSCVAASRGRGPMKKTGDDMADSAPKKPNGLQKIMQPSPELAAVIGDEKLSRGDVVSKMWTYIKQHNLQNPSNKREIVADEKLKPVFGGKDKVDMFEMNKHLANHLK
jgi:chromatin remodeling complex protein RSC6